MSAVSDHESVRDNIDEVGAIRHAIALEHKGDVTDIKLLDRVTDDVRGLVVLEDLEADWRHDEIDLCWPDFEFEFLILDIEVWGNGLTESDWVRNLAIFDEAGKREFLVVKNVRDSAFTIANGEFDARRANL